VPRPSLPSPWMRRRLGLLPALAAGLLVAGAAGEAQEAKPHPVLVQQGKELYQQYCASCHGMEGRGEGPVAGVLANAPADLTRIAARRGGEFPDAEIALFIDGRFAPEAHGTREMPVWGRRFTEELPASELQQPIVRGRILVLVEFLKSIQQGA